MKLSLFSASFLFIASANGALKTSTRSTGDLTDQHRVLAEMDDHDHDHDHDHDENHKCKEYEIDFVMIEGDAVRASVESEIVEMLEHVGIKVNTRKLTKKEFNAAEKAGDFHMSFSETWGAPYDPHAYAKGWIAGDEGHFRALSGLGETRDNLFEKIEEVLKEDNDIMRGERWEDIHKMVHNSAVMLPLWGSTIPTVLNTKRLSKYQPGYQQFDYPVHLLDVVDGDKTVTIAPGAQTGRFESVGRLDPHTYRPNEFFSNNWVYEGLTSYGAQGEVYGALALNWTISDQGEGQRYTFQLRPNVQFHDGEEWNCAAAKLNFDHVLAGPLTHGDYHGWYGMIDQITNWECVGELFAVDLKNKYYPFLQELSFIRPLRMLSPGAFVDTNPFTSNSCHAGWGNVTHPDTGETVVCVGTNGRIAGTGPFKFESRDKFNMTLPDGEIAELDDEVVFKANTAYWDEAPSIETLIVKYYDSAEAVKAALEDGSLDLVWGSGVLTTKHLVELDQDKANDLKVFYSDDIQNVIVMLNSEKPPLDDINVRKTIIHAINKMEIINHSLDGIFKPVDNVFPLDAPYCDVVLTPRWDYDLEKAELINCVDTEPAKMEKDRSLALGLGLGLGLTSAVLVAVSFFFVRRSKNLENKLEQLALKEEAVSA